MSDRPPPRSLGEALPREMARVLRDVLPGTVAANELGGIGRALFAVLTIACDATAEQDLPKMCAAFDALRKWSALPGAAPRRPFAADLAADLAIALRGTPWEAEARELHRKLLAAVGEALHAQRSAAGFAFICPDCGFASPHPVDGREGYCVRCHTFPEDRAARRQAGPG